MTLLLHSIDASFGFDAWKAMTNPDIFLLEPRTNGYSIERIWDAAFAVDRATSAPQITRFLPARTTVSPPRLTEPWFC